MSSTWKRLGIARTRERADIRRAYAARLKVTNPEDDPEGFQRLREAYEAALAYAQSGYDYDDDLGESFWDEDDGDDGEPAPAAADADDLLSAPDRWDDDGTARDDLIDLRDLRRAVRREARASAQGLEAARTRLARLVEAEAQPDDEAMVAALEAVLSSDALEDLGAYTWTETWLSRLIAWGFPRTDPLVSPAIERFDWRQRATGLGSTHEIERVLAREDDLRFLRQIGLKRHPQNPTWRVLLAGAGASPLQRLRAAWMAKSVQMLLESIGSRYPTVMDSLDHKVVDFWTGYFSRPRIGPITMIIAMAVPLFVAVVAAASPEVATLQQRLVAGLLGLGGALAAVIGAIALKYFAFDVPRHRWTTDWSWRAPPVAKGGWAGLGLVSILAMAALPGHLAAVILAAVLASGVLLWSFAVAERDGHAELSSRLAVIAFSNLSPAFLWLFMMSEGRSALEIWQTSLVAAATGAAFSRAPIVLSEGWFDLLDRPHRLAASASATIAAAGVAVWIAATPSGAVPSMLAAAAAVCCSLVQRPAALRGTDGERKVRYFGGIVIGVTTFVGGSGAGLSLPAIAGVMLAASATLSLAVTLVSQIRR